MKNEFITDQKNYNSGIRDAWLPIWTKNAFENYEHIKELFREKHCDLYEFKADRKIHRYAFVIGSGPSLDRVIPLLKRWEGDIYCSSSQLLVLQAHGIRPSACFIIDADPKMSYLVEEVDTTDIPLITNPCMDPNVIKAWKGPIYWFRMYDPGDPLFKDTILFAYQDLHHDITQQEQRRRGINTHVLNGGCIVNTMCAVLPTFGHQRIFLAGVDLGFPNDIQRFTNVKKVGNTYVDIPSQVVNSGIAPVVANNGIRTDKVSIFYKYSFMMLYGVDQSDIVSCSEGILSEIPYMDPETVVEKQGDIGIMASQEERFEIARKYLSKRSLFIIKTAKDKRVVNVQSQGRWAKYKFLIEYKIKRLLKIW